MTPRLQELDTIIFDLGEVVVDLDPQAVVIEFARLTGADANKIQEVIVQSDHLYEYETGQLTDQGFVDAVNALFKTEVSLSDFKNAWNMMISDVPKKRLDFLETLKNTHQVLLLSNTNKMHEEYFDEEVRKQTGKMMKDFAHTAYYSHLVGLRKPEAGIYQHMIDEKGLKPERALFLDDREENIIAAQEVGLQAIQITQRDQIFDLLRG